MGRKGKFFRVRSDESLKASADKCNRQEADQARHLIMLALGMIDDSEKQTVLQRVKHPARRQQRA